jgi:hypothetical protein
MMEDGRDQNVLMENVGFFLAWIFDSMQQLPVPKCQGNQDPTIPISLPTNVFCRIYWNLIGLGEIEEFQWKMLIVFSLGYLTGCNNCLCQKDIEINTQHFHYQRMCFAEFVGI